MESRRSPLKMVLPTFFDQKTSTIGKFEKGTLYFLAKTIKIEKFDKGIPMLFYQKPAKISK